MYLFYSKQIEAQSDEQAPTYSLNSTNSTLAGTAVSHNLYWEDNVELSHAIFSFDNCTGTLQNISSMSLDGNSAWSNFTVVINSTVGCTIRWCVYANDTSNNWNSSSCQNPFSYVTTSPLQTTTAPFYPNQRAICRDGKNYIHVVWKYDANTISYAKSTGNGETWIVNNTIVNSTGSKGLPSISCDGNNITIAYRNGTSGVVIYISENNGASFTEKVPYSSGIGEYVSVERRGQRIYVVYEDTDAYTDIEFFNSSDSGETWSPKIVILDGHIIPKIASFEYYEPSLVVDGDGGANDRIHIVAKGIEEDLTAGEVYYIVQYINSSDSGINWGSDISLITGSGITISNPSITYNGTKVYVSYYREDRIYFNLSSDYGVTWSGERIDTIADTSKAQYPTTTTNLFGYPLVLWQQNDTSNNKRWNIIYRNNSGTWDSPVWITTDIAGDNVYPNSKYQYSAGCIEFVYRNGVSSPYNIIYGHLGTCTAPSLAYLEVELSSPPLSYNVNQNSTFTVNATVYCRAGNCGNVYGTVRYNASSPYPDTDINTTQGDKPFFIQESPALATKACPTNPLDQNKFCNLTWTINATGDVNSVWRVGVLFNSSLAGVEQNHTQNSTITIVSGIESLSLAWSSIDFGFLIPNTPAENNPAPGNENKLYNITNTGTCSPNLWIKGVDLQNLTFNSFIAVGNLSWSNSSSTYNPSTVYSLKYNYELLHSALPPNSNLTTYYWLSVPSVYAGLYEGTITICGNCSTVCD